MISAKGRRQPKPMKPKKMIKVEGKHIVFTACNSGTSALVTREGELYMYGKDTTHCNDNSGESEASIHNESTIKSDDSHNEATIKSDDSHSEAPINSDDSHNKAIIKGDDSHNEATIKGDDSHHEAPIKSDDSHKQHLNIKAVVSMLSSMWLHGDPMYVNRTENTVNLFQMSMT